MNAYIFIQPQKSTEDFLGCILSFSECSDTFKMNVMHWTPDGLLSHEDNEMHMWPPSCICIDYGTLGPPGGSLAFCISLEAGNSDAGRDPWLVQVGVGAGRTRPEDQDQTFVSRDSSCMIMLQWIHIQLLFMLFIDFYPTFFMNNCNTWLGS